MLRIFYFYASTFLFHSLIDSILLSKFYCLTKLTNFKLLFKREGFQKYFKNTFWMLLEKFFRIITSLIVGVWVARYLGPSQYGAFQFAFSIVSIFSAVATLGLDEIVVRELVKDKNNKEVLLGTSFVLKLIGAGASILLLLSSIQFLDNDEIINKMILVIGFSTLFHSFNVIDLFFRSEVVSKYATYANFFSLLFASIVKIILILAGAPLISFAVVVIFESLILAMGYVYFLWISPFKIPLKTWKFDLLIAKNLLSDSWPLIFASMVLMIQSRIDQVMLKELSSTAEVGYYSVALRIIEMLAFLPALLQNSFLPSLVNSKKISEALYQDRQLNYYRLNFLLFLITAIPIYFFSDLIISVLYGKEYVAAIPILAFMSFRIFFNNMGIARSGFINVENLYKYSMFTMILGTIVNIVLNYFLIPQYFSMGAVFSTIISFSVTLFVVDLFYSKTRGNVILQIKSMLTFYKLRINFIN